jgi:hypothetical protein
MRPDLATTITEKLLDLMAKHGTNWRQPWVGQGLQRNAVSKKPYRGVNTLILATSGLQSPWFATYKQWHEMGAQVRQASVRLAGVVGLAAEWENLGAVLVHCLGVAFDIATVSAFRGDGDDLGAPPLHAGDGAYLFE